MTPGVPPVLPPVLPGRECGGCNVCCVALTIDDPALRKAQGYRCKNAMADNLCAIYHDRPQTCRAFECGWRVLKWVRDTLRPDRSGVLVRLHNEISAEDGSMRTGIIVSLLKRQAVHAEGLAETVAAAINADLPVYLHVPGPPGPTSGVAKLNEALEHAVLTRDKAAVLDVLRQGRQQGLKGRTVPIVFKSRAAAGPDPEAPAHL